MTPREKAEACFAKARSTTSAHERDNAVTLGTRVAEKAGLDLDTFDIPGRSRPRRPTMSSHGALTPEEMEALAREIFARMDAETMSAVYRPRQPRYCPHGSDMALFGDSCVLCERERRQQWRHTHDKERGR